MRLRRGVVPVLAALMMSPAFAAAKEVRVLATPILSIEADDGTLRLSAAVAGQGGQTVTAELTVVREANGSSSRTKQSAQVVLSGGTPQSVSTVGLGGNPLDRLEARLTVSFDGRQIAETTTILSPAIE